MAPSPPTSLPEDASPPAPPLGPARLSRRPTPSRVPWADLLKRTFRVDVLLCDKCGGRRRVLAVVTRSTTCREILLHLNLPAAPLPMAPARDPPQLPLYPV